MRLRPGTVTFVVVGALVVAVSVLLSMRRGDAAAGPNLPRFSGSTVVQRMGSLLADARLPQRLPVAIIRDPSAASYYDRPAALDSIVDAWKWMLTQVDADVRVVSPTAAEGATWARVIVVPSSPCLTMETRTLIEAAGGRRQGVVLTGAAGVNDGGCRLLGYGLIVSATGATRATPLEPRSMVYVTFPASSILSADIPPGSRLDLKPGTQVALRVLGRDAYYSDYDLHPLPASSQVLLDGAVAHADDGRRRIVYWGFDLRDAVDQPWNTDVLRLLVRNTIAYSARLPLGALEPWPGGRRAAAALAQDVEDRFANSRHALDSLKAIGAPATYFLTSQMAKRNTELTTALDAAGEVGTHSENHHRLGGLSMDVQRTRLATTQQDLVSLLGRRVRGLRPPEEQFDSATMAAWIANGGTYLFGANDSRTAAPELLAIGRDTIVLLGRVAGDDFALAARARTSNADTIAAIAMTDYARLRALGGLYVLSYHSQMFGRPERVPALARLARGLMHDTTTWLATTGAIAAWWRARADLHVNARQIGTNRVDVVVQNRGARVTRDAVVRIVLPQQARVTATGAFVLGNDGSVVRVLVPPVRPHGTVTFSLTSGSTVRPAALSRPRGRVHARARRRPHWYEFWR